MVLGRAGWLRSQDRFQNVGRGNRLVGSLGDDRGRIVFHNGKVLILDEDLLRRKAQELALRLNAANEVAPARGTYGEARPGLYEVAFILER
jgi:hypothetical protein